MTLTSVRNIKTKQKGLHNGSEDGGAHCASLQCKPAHLSSVLEPISKLSLELYMHAVTCMLCSSCVYNNDTFKKVTIEVYNIELSLAPF